MNPRRQSGAALLISLDPEKRPPHSQQTGSWTLAMIQQRTVMQNKTHQLLGIENVWETFNPEGNGPVGPLPPQI